ncbi:MAG: hypothetical protein HUU02_03990 [Bacteroidetes bacterium]|nr:hypothetical protein [Bacteroidota bacterium]
MKHNRIITISEHAVDRFIERFHFAGKDQENESAVRAAAERTIVSIWETASYVSDDSQGILFRNLEFNCDFVVFGKQIKTLFNSRPAARQPENHSTTDLRLQSAKSPSHNSRFRQSTQQHKPRR